MKNKIFLVCDALDERGGVERLVTLNANKFCENYEVKILIRYRRIADLPYKLYEDVEVLSCDIDKNIRGMKKIFSFYQYIKWLKIIVKKEKPHVVFSNGLNISVLTSISLLFFRDIKLIICDHNKFEKGSIFWKIARFIFYRKSNQIISLTMEDLPKYKKLGNSLVIYNPVIPPLVKTEVNFNKKEIIAIGRLEWQKGFDLLIKSWKYVYKKHPAWHLRIIGDGSEEENLKKMTHSMGLADSIFFEKSTKDVFEKLKMASLFVLSSRHEGMPLMLLEAMSIGLPVVAFDCKTGPKEVLSTGGGALAKAEDVEDLSEKIINYISHPEEWIELSKKAKMTAERFELGNYFLQMNNVIQPENNFHEEKH